MTRVAPFLLFLLVFIAACTPEGQPPTTAMPASTEPFDLARLNGKVIRIEAVESDYRTPHNVVLNLRVVGNTIIWDDLRNSQCVLGGRKYGDGMALLYTWQKPRTGTKIPCEALRSYLSGWSYALAPADVQYSTTFEVRGNVLELSGELTEHNSEDSWDKPSSPVVTITKDVTQRQLLKLRVSGDQCQVLDLVWTSDVREMRSDSGRPVQYQRRVRATGCSIVLPKP